MQGLEAQRPRGGHQASDPPTSRQGRDSTARASGPPPATSYFRRRLAALVSDRLQVNCGRAGPAGLLAGMHARCRLVGLCATLAVAVGGHDSMPVVTAVLAWTHGHFSHVPIVLHWCRAPVDWCNSLPRDETAVHSAVCLDIMSSRHHCGCGARGGAAGVRR